MRRNIRTSERVVRVSVGLVILALGICFQDWWGALGLLPLVSGAVGWSPAYVPFWKQRLRGRRRAK